MLGTTSLYRVLVLILATHTLYVDGYCLADDDDPYSALGGDTPYEAADSDIHAAPDFVPGCSPILFWHFSRHGTRKPKAKTVQRVMKILPTLKKQIMQNWADGVSDLCEDDVKNIYSSSMVLTQDESERLTPQGVRDLFALGARYRKRLPELFEQYTKKDDYEMYCDHESRTRASARAFSQGFLGIVDDIMDDQEEDPIPAVRFSSYCPRYDNYHQDPATFHVMSSFSESPVMLEVIDRVSRRLGFNANLTFNEVLAMYEMCQTDRSNRWSADKYAPWCAAFRKDDMDVFDYRYDLRQYYWLGYGNELGPRVGCRVIENLIAVLRAKVEHNEGPAGVLLFSHQTELGTALATLGMFRDESAPEAHNYHEMKDRTYRASKFLPYAANMAVILYRCTNDPNEEYFVRAHLNEKPMELRNCGDNSLLCPWSTFVREYGPIAERCDLVDLCREGDHTYPTHWDDKIPDR